MSLSDVVNRLLTGADVGIDESSLGTASSAGSASRRVFVERCAAFLLGALGAHRAKGLKASMPGGSSQPAARWSQSRTLFGAAVIEREIRRGSPFAPLIARTCQIITPNGQMHWQTTRPDAESFDFSHGDQAVEFAKQNNMAVRGHTLVWHQMTGDWLAHTINANNARALLSEHIQGLLRHFAGSMHSWDVVNEAVRIEDGRADGLRDSLWLRNAGADYIEFAFAEARRADPTALLGYNETGLEDDSATAERKRAAVFRLLQNWRAAGVPIDYLGIQSHITVGRSYSAAHLGCFLERVRALGLRVFVTEMDVDDSSLPADLAVRDAAVADLYDRYLAVVLSAVDVPVVMTWGITDVNSWLQRYNPRADGAPHRPLPFDERLQPKPAWRVLRRRLDLSQE